MEMICLYRLNDFITVRDDVTMITIDNIYESKDVMGAILENISQMNMEIDIVDYHINYKGSKLTLLVENSGILRAISAAGMFKDKINSIMCDVYCLNTAITVATQKTPIDDAVKIIRELEKCKIELYHLFAGIGGLTVVINEAYTDRVCDLLVDVFS